MSRAILGLLITVTICIGFASADANAGQYQFITTDDDRYLADSIQVTEKFKSIELFNGDVVYRLHFARIARIIGPDGDDLTVSILGDAAPPEMIAKHELEQERLQIEARGEVWEPPVQDRAPSNRALLVVRWRGMAGTGDGASPNGGFQLVIHLPIAEKLAFSLHFDQSSFWTDGDQIRSFMFGFTGFNSLSDVGNGSSLVHYGMGLGFASTEGRYGGSSEGGIIRLQLGATPMISSAFGIDMTGGFDAILAGGSSGNSGLFFVAFGANFRL